MGIIYTAVLRQGKKGDNNHDPLSTIGDAIVSFLKKPDTTTVSMCLVDNVNIVNKPVLSKRVTLRNKLRFWQKPKTSTRVMTTPATLGLWHSPTPQRWEDEKPRWMAAASWRRWLLTIIS
jgi:hypothetical protein